MAIYIRDKVTKNILSMAKITSDKYKVKGSVGQTNWADVPWIAVMDKDITEYASRGYYIVYLFCADMSGVYISLNQGWKYFEEKYEKKQIKNKEKKAIKDINAVTNAWKRLLSSTLNDFSFEEINLKGISKSSNRPKGYELGHICGKFYEAGNIPEDSKLIEDLNLLLGVYRELKGKMKGNSIENTNDSLILNTELGVLESGDEDSDELDNIMVNLKTTSTLLIDDAPEQFSNNDYDQKFIPKKTNFLKKARNQKKLGFAGELMVIKHEKDRLIAAGRNDLAERVRHVSKEDGDGAGYDILSYDEDNKDSPKYIEVKTTVGEKTTPFILTETEVNFSDKNSLNFYLYRVFKFDKKNLQGKLFILKGDIESHLELKPQQYIVSGIKNNDANQNKEISK
jgi:hypothetical protein